MYLPKPTEGGDFTPAPAGTFIATCYRFIDLGTHVSEFNGDRKTRHEVMLSWELTDEFIEPGRPFTINKRYTWSMHEKATLRKHLEAWRGVPFKDDDFDGDSRFDIKNIIGKPCTLTITHTAKEGKTYAGVGGVGKMMKGASASPLTNPAVYLALSDESFDPNVYGQLSDYYKTLISDSPEYKDIMQKRRQGDDPVATRNNHEFDDSIPF